MQNPTSIPVPDADGAIRSIQSGWTHLPAPSPASHRASARILSRGIIVMLGIFLSLAVPLWAQIGGSGSITGSIADPTGAVISGAVVTATNNSTNVQTTQKTTSSGNYVLSPLAPGVYTVTVTAPGFKTLTQEHVSVDALQNVGLRIQLTLGANSEQVTVQSAPPQLDTTSGTVGTTIENQEYTALPLQMNGGPRDPTAFVYLTPGVAHGGNGVQTGIFDGTGSQGRLDEIYIDGFPQTSIYEQGDPRYVSNIISVEAVDQFQVVTSDPPAQYQGVGLENYVVKSGTNNWHGSVFDYFRDTALDTWGFYAPAVVSPSVGHAVKPLEHQTEYGVDLGAPIKHDKIFFFGNYDGFLYHKDNNPAFTTIPTMLMRTGNFSELPATQTIYDPASCPNGVTAPGFCQRQQAFYNGTPNAFNPARIGPTEQFMIKFMPKPINTSINNNYLSEIPSDTFHWDTTERIDIKMTSKQQFSFIFGAERGGVYGYQSNGGNPGPLPYTSGQGYETKNKLFLIEHTYAITPNLVNQFKYGYSRFSGPVFNPDYRNPGYGLGTDGGVTGLPKGQASGSFPTVNWGGNNPITKWSGDQDYNALTNYFTILDNVQYVHGKHSFTFGGVHEWLELNNYAFTGGSSPVTLNYSNAETANYINGTELPETGDSFASFLLSQVDSGNLTQEPFTDTGARMRPTSFYAQDDYAITPKLTVNIGMRWDFFPPYREVLDRYSFLNTTMTNPITGNAGALEFAGNGSDSCHCSTNINNWYKNFGPRLGGAYSATNKIVIRGGFSITYSHGTGYRNATYLGTGQTGFYATPSITSTVAGSPAFLLDGGFPSYAAPPSLNAGYGTGFTSAKHSATSSMSYGDPYLGSRAPYAVNYNFGIEQQLTSTISFTLNYVGSQGHFLPVSNGGARGLYSNQLPLKYYNLGGLLNSAATPANVAAAEAIDPGIALPYPTFSGTILQMLLPFPQYPGINDTYDNIVNSSYNALQASLNKRMSHGLQFMFNYTFGAEIDDGGTYRSGYLPNRIERGRGIADTPNVITATAVYQLPFGRGQSIASKNRIARALASDWQISSIGTYSSGTPLAIVASGCNTPGGGQCMPNYNPSFSGPVRINGHYGSHVLANQASPSYINKAAFINAPPAYTFGNVARTAPYGLRGPTSYDIDMSLKRDIPIGHRIHLLFDVSAYNLTNSVIFNSPAVNTGATNFGEVSSQANLSRDIQLAARINF